MLHRGSGFRKSIRRVSSARCILLVANPSFLVSSGVVLDPTISDLVICHVGRHSNLCPRRIRIQSVWPGAGPFIKQRPLVSQLSRAERHQKGHKRTPLAHHVQREKRHRRHSPRRLEYTTADGFKNVSQRFRANFTSQRRPKSLAPSLALTFRRTTIAYLSSRRHLLPPSLPQPTYLSPR